MPLLFSYGSLQQENVQTYTFGRLLQVGVPWPETGVGQFAPAYVDEGLTFDFDEWTESIPLSHFCFRGSHDDFTAILKRIKVAGIPYRRNVHAPVDYRIDTQHAGGIVYWSEPDGHQWEMLTVSYARQPQ